MVFDRFVDSINSGSVDFLLCAPPGSSCWVSSFRDVIWRGRYGRPGIQPAHKEQVRIGTLLRAPWGHCVCCRTETRHLMDCGTIPTAGRRTGVFFFFRRVDRSFANAGSGVIFCFSPLAPTRGSPACSTGQQFSPFAFAAQFGLTSSEICQALIEGILITHAVRHRAPVANGTGVGAWQNVLVRATLLSSHLSVNNMPCAPALFETRPRLNQLAPLRPITVASKEIADQRAVGGVLHPARAVARLAHALEAGQAVRDLLLPFLRRPGVLQSCLSAIGSDREDVGPTPDIIKDAREMQ